MIAFVINIKKDVREINNLSFCCYIDLLWWHPRTTPPNQIDYTRRMKTFPARLLFFILFLG